MFLTTIIIAFLYKNIIASLIFLNLNETLFIIYEFYYYRTKKSNIILWLISRILMIASYNSVILIRT
jgi:hypothetical protein